MLPLNPRQLAFSLILIGLVGLSPAGAQSPEEKAYKDIKGKLLVIRIDEGLAADLAAAVEDGMRGRLQAAGRDLDGKVLLARGPDETARALLNQTTAGAVGAVVDLRLSPAAASVSGPLAVVEVYHAPFGAIAREHVRSPEYSFKFASDSALMAICLHKAAEVSAEAGIAEHEGRRLLTALEVRPATDANPLLPESFRRKTVVLRLTPHEALDPARAASLGDLLAEAFVAYQANEESAVMGVLSDRARKRANPENCEIAVYPYVYSDRELDKEGAKAREEAMSRALATVKPFTSGLFYVKGLDRLAPYSYTVTDPTASELRREVDKGAFVTASIRGVVRTVPVRLESYAPLAPPKEDAGIVADAPPEFDVVIEGATVFDGTKDRPRFVADVAIAGERIAAVGDLKGNSRKETIDAKGLFLMPGFVDIHSHADSDIFKVQYAPSQVRQGITTVLGGNCASSPLSIGDFLREVEEKGAAVNIGILVGNKPIRQRVLGKRKGMFSYDELYREKELVDLAMEEGAFGMSTGLIYSISEEAFAWELAEMSKQLKPYGGFYASHVRGETDEVLDAIREAIHIGELAEVPVQISHMKVLQKQNWGQMTDYLSIMKSARARGLDVTGDQYPWLASGPAAHYGLHRLLAREAVVNDNPQGVLLKDMPGKYAKYSGRQLSELLKEEGMTAEDLIRDLNLTPESKLYATYLCIGPDDLVLPMKEDFVMVCTDAGMVSLEAIEQGKAWDEHPRKFRTYPEFFSRYVRDRRVCSWELGVYKCTGLPAWRMKLSDRGVVKPGTYADLVILDPERLDPGADFRDQTPPPKGVTHVFINGRAAVKDGEMTKTRAGKPLYAYGNRKP